MNFTVKLADKTVYVEHIHPELKEFCKDYLVEATAPDFSIQLTPDDILLEKEQAMEQTFSEAYLETLALLRKISEVFPLHHRILIHGASISYQDKAYLFTAPSGTGKSTHIRLWKKYLGDDVGIVNGDKPFLSLDTKDSDGKMIPYIYGTPWAGKERWQKNCVMPLNGICFIQRGTDNTIRRIQPEECLSLLFNQVYIPSDSASVGLTLELMDALLKSVPFYLLQCDMSEDAVRCSFEAMTGLTYPID